MTLREIIARINLKHRIIDGTIYCIIENNDVVEHPQVRPASDQEISRIQVREICKSYAENRTIPH